MENKVISATSRLSIVKVNIEISIIRLHIHSLLYMSCVVVVFGVDIYLASYAWFGELFVQISTGIE